MTNEELLAGFLDRSLTEDDLLELEARASASPELARELRELVAMESRIKQAAPAVLFPTAFLATVENSIAASLAAAAVTAGVAGAASGLSSWLPLASAAVLGVAGVGTAIYFIAATPSKTVAPSPSTPVVAPAPSVAPQPPQPTTNPIEEPPASRRETAVRTADAPARPTSITNDQANLQRQNPPTALERARIRFEQSEGLSRVQAGLALASIDKEQADAILLSVQMVADENSLRQYQAEVRARRAALASPTNAATLYRDAIRYGTNVVPPSVIDEWRRRLDAIGN